MILQLVMPYLDRAVPGGVILKWHKAEGERVGYGDDIFDIKVELKVRRSTKSRGEKIRMMKDGRPVEDEDLKIVEEETPGLVYFVRVTSSDMGFIRKIFVKESSYADVGGHLALLSTEEQEDLSSIDQVSARMSEFRVVPNIVPLS